MRHYLLLLLFTLGAMNCWAGERPKGRRAEAEYYVAVYARHYGLPLDFVRSIVEQESGWHSCAVSPKGAAGLMQIMPATARWLGISNRCDLRQNVAGGVRYLAWLNRKFGGDLRLVAAAYYAGEHIIEKRGLSYHNQDVIAYVASVRAAYARQRAAAGIAHTPIPRRRITQ